MHAILLTSNLMDSIKVEVKAPLSCKGAGVLSRPYLVYPFTVSTLTVSGSSSRRYTDFELFRTKLSVVYWYCIIPPLPEKESVLENLGIYDAPNYEERVGHIRREEFRQFLQHVYGNPIFGKEVLLRQFLNDEEWCEVVSAPYSTPSFLDFTSISSMAQHLFKKASHQKNAGRETVSLEIQRQHLHSLRKQFQLSISHRKDGTSALKNFGENFKVLCERDNDGARPLYNTINKVCVNVTLGSSVEFAKEERLLAILNYWYNMCGAALETFKNISAADVHYKTVIQQIETLKNTPSKANTDISYVDNLRNLEKDRDYIYPILKDAESLCKDQLKKFQNEMNLDLNTFLICYHTLLNHSAEVMRLATTDAVI